MYAMAKKKSEKKPTKRNFKIPFKKLLVFNLALLGGLLIIIVMGLVYFNDKVYPGIKVANTDLTALTPQASKLLLSQTLRERLNKKVTFEDTFTIDLSSELKSLQIDSSLEDAMQYGHSKIYFKPIFITLNLPKNSNLSSQLSLISKQVDAEPINSQLKVDAGQINVTPSQDGLILDQEKLSQILTNYLNTGNLETNKLPLKKVSPSLSYAQALSIKKRLDQIKLVPLKLTFKDLSFTLDLEEVISLIDLNNSQSSLAQVNLNNQRINLKSVKVGTDEVNDFKFTLNDSKLASFLSKISQEIDRDVEEPLFNFDPSGGQEKVKEFRPGQIGRRLNVKKAKEEIYLSLITPSQTQVNLPVEEIQPKNKLTNDLGINELIGQGVSNFAHSIENRIFNVNLGAQKLNGTLIPPGEVFSFNQTLGDITAATGFKQAYVIKSGRTVLDDGGGICQVSTTIFRAVLNAGLPVISRTAHAYRVAYYEQGFPPGLDATTYYPSVDFKFKNDTNHHILIQSYTVGLTMYVDLYGTSDGRIANITTPVVLNQTPAPPELRQDDPTLPKGTVKQVDFAATGAKVIFKRSVVRNGETIINESFTSNYRPWQAVFLVGTKEG